MRKPRASGMTEDIVKLDQALLASLKGLRGVAERIHQGAESPEDKARLGKILERKIVHGKTAAPIVQKEKAGPFDARLRRMGRFVSVLPEGQYQIVLDLAKTMARQQRSGPKTGPKPDLQELK